jgi:uncharacterized protein (DUF983 family)
MTNSQVWQGLSRGFALRCPNCGKAPLLRRYLKVVAVCPACGHDNGQYPADDAPPYFTILIVGHLVVAPVLFLPVIWRLPTWQVLAIAVPLVAALTLALLPRVKGAVIGLHWAIRRIEGQVPGQDDSPLWTPRAGD